MAFRRLSFRSRLLFLVVILVGVGTAVPATVLIERQRRIDWNDQARNLERVAQVQAQRVERIIEDLGRDAVILSQVPPITGIMRATAHGGRDPQDASTLEMWRQRLAVIFASFAASRTDYAQMRLIGVAHDGREIVRVNRDDGQVVLVPDDALQSKGERSYFRDTRLASPGRVYLSEIDLNQEHHILDNPPNPMVRATMPLVDGRGDFFGALVINLRIQEILDELSAAAPAGITFFIANARGDWLVHPDPARRFGIDLGHGHGWHEEFAGLTQERADDTPLLRALPAWGDGVRRFAVTQTVAPWLSGRRWPLMTLAYVVPEEELNNQLVPLYRGILLVSLLVGTSILILATVVVGRVTAPLAALANAAKLVAEGRYDILLPRAGPDELGTLIDAFRHLRERVWRREWDLRQLNSELEQRIDARTRDLVVARNQAEALARAKADFLANMSHEIRTPMNAMMGLGYILERQDLPAESRDLLRKLQRSGRTLQGIIDDVLNFSKLEAGRFAIEAQPFRLGEVCDSVATIMSTAAADKDLELVISPAKDGVDWVVGDALRLEQVLINLVNNAIKFTEQGLVELRVEVVSCSDTQASLRFQVVDTGIGMSEADMGRVFAPFVQADSSVERRYGGTGLGLAISRQLVVLMGGELSATSRVGEGSCFQFTLSFARPSGGYVSDMVALDVVVADDHYATREALRRVVGALGWTPHVVESGDDAVQAVTSLAGATQPSALVVVLDWQMPGMDGLEALRILRQSLERPQDTVILMVTAFAREDLLSQPDAGLADAVLTKPVTASMLYDAVIAAKWKLGHKLLPTRRADRPRLDGLRLLIVDDNDINREVAQRIFSSEGAQVSIANSGHQALEWLVGHVGMVDAVLMDVQMPGMDGHEATRLLRGLEGMADLPVVALSASALPEHRQAALQAGMNDFLSKPFDVAKAVSLLATLTGRGQTGTLSSPGPDPLLPPVVEEGAYPGIDENQALALWGSRPVFARYLRRFVAEGAETVAAIAAAPPAQGARLAHKLKGTAGNLGLGDVLHWADEVDNLLRRDEDASAALAALEQVTATALASSAIYLAEMDAENAVALAETGGAVAARGGHAAPADPAGLVVLCAELLTALDSDSPDEVDPVLARLATALPAADLAEVVAAVEVFDFRGAEARLRELMARWGAELPPVPPPAEAADLSSRFSM